MRIQVLMSTYNGEEYVEQQIRSINQNINSDITLDLLIRDDGSLDKTIEIIKRLMAEMDITIKLVQGENVGVSKSFLKLINMASEADLYFLCDQDDVWTTDKIQTIIDNCFSLEEAPQLFVSGYYLTDSQLNIIKECRFGENTQNTLLQILFANEIPGCTMAFNIALMRELKREIPQNVPMHDIYVLATAYCIGKIYYINKSLVYYRQHGSNTEGVQSSKIDLKRVFRKQKKLLAEKHNYTKDLANYIFYKYQKKLTFEKLKKLEMAINYRTNIISKWNLLKEKEIYYHNVRSDILTIEKIFLNKF